MVFEDYPDLRVQQKTEEFELCVMIAQNWRLRNKQGSIFSLLWSVTQLSIHSLIELTTRVIEQSSELRYTANTQLEHRESLYYTPLECKLLNLHLLQSMLDTLALVSFLTFLTQS